MDPPPPPKLTSKNAPSPPSAGYFPTNLPLPPPPPKPRPPPIRAGTPLPSSGPPFVPGKSDAELRTLADNIEILGIEEGSSCYKRRGFHPVQIGDIINGWMVHRKLGWGRYSTVWLVQNLQTEKFRALKILSASINHEVSLTYEIEALVTLKVSRPKYPNHHGYNYINHFEDYFWFKGENGSHQCIITKVMAEHLGYFAAWFSNGEIPRPLVQHFARQLIMALDYAHHCDIAHNDIQHANIMIQLPDDDLEPIINRYLAATKSSIVTNRYDTSHTRVTGTVVLTKSQSLHNYYLNDGVDLMTLTIALIDWGFAIFEGYLPEGMTYHLTFQPPETMFLAPRGLQVDAWNLGMLLPDLIFGEALFGNNLISGEYSFKSHLEEINQLLGPFPKHLLESGKQHQDMFDDRGDVKDPEYGVFLNLQERFSSIEGEEGPKFLDLVLSILQIDPEKRLEMMDLLAHPWMLHDYVPTPKFSVVFATVKDENNPRKNIREMLIVPEDLSAAEVKQAEVQSEEMDV